MFVNAFLMMGVITQGRQMNKRFDIVAFGGILWDVIDGVPHIGGASGQVGRRACTRMAQCVA